MPKKNKTQDGKKSHALMYTLIIILVLAVWLAIFAFATKLDMFGMGQYLRPMLEDVPVLNRILPELSEAEIADRNNYPYSSLKEAIARIQELETQLAEERDKSKETTASIESLQAEIDRLKVFEENQLEFEQRVKEFDEKVVFSDDAIDIEEYKKYYEQFGLNVVYYRKKKRLTQMKLAELVDIDRIHRL